MKDIEVEIGFYKNHVSIINEIKKQKDMKTKTIYHLDYDCNIVSIEVVTKVKKNKKRSITKGHQQKNENDSMITEKHFPHIIKAQNESEPQTDLKYSKDSHTPVQLFQNKEISQVQFPQMILCSEAYQNFVSLLQCLSPLDAEKQLYGMLLSRIPIMEEVIYQTQQKPSQVDPSGWRKRFSFDEE